MEKQILNGCGGKKGTKCYVEQYTMPYGRVRVNSPKRKTDRTIGQKAAGN